MPRHLGRLYHRLLLAFEPCDTRSMPKRVSLNVSLTAELVAFVAQKVSSGRYGSASEVVRMGLRLLEEKEPLSPAPPKTDDQAKAASHER